MGRWKVVLLFATLVYSLVYGAPARIRRLEKQETTSRSTDTSGSNNLFIPDKEQQVTQPDEMVNPPNIVIFLVDDLGWNQVGYHANVTGNHEIKTPHIDSHAADGVKLERGYMTPWCGPSRAAIMTGRTNSYNGNVSNTIATFDDDIGFVAGLPPGTSTLATAFKAYGESIGKPYSAYCKYISELVL